MERGKEFLRAISHPRGRHQTHQGWIPRHRYWTVSNSQRWGASEEGLGIAAKQATELKRMSNLRVKRLACFTSRIAGRVRHNSNDCSEERRRAGSAGSRQTNAAPDQQETELWKAGRGVAKENKLSWQKTYIILIIEA